MFCFAILGEPWRIVLRKFFEVFKSLDIPQILVLDVYLGGFLLYVIAIIPLHLFSITTLYAITLVSTVIVFWLHRKKFGNVAQTLHLFPKKSLLQNRRFFEPLLVVLMFLFSLVIQVLPLSALFFGSVRDTAIHSLFVQVLIENKQIPVTLQPYLDEGIIYPQGFTPVIAYSALILNYSPPQAVFYVTALFNALTILGVYFLGKMLSLDGKRFMGLSLAFVFVFIASWPKSITWGSNTFVASFPLYFICLSLFPFIAKSKLKTGTIFATGVLFGYLSALHLQTYEMLIASLFVVWIYIAIKREKDRWSRLGYFIAISGLGLLVLSPFIYRQLTFYQYPYHNIGIPADVEIPIAQFSISLVLWGIAWLFENLASNALLSVALLALFFISILITIYFGRRKSLAGTHKLVALGIASLVGELLIFLLGAFSPYDLPFYPQPILLYFPIYFFIAALNFHLYRLFSSYLSRKFLKELNEPRFKTKKILVSSVSLMLVLGIYSPFLYQSIVLDAERLYGSYTVFSVTTEQDLQLISWIKDNLPRNASILINNFQSGAFISSIANRRVVYPSVGSSYSASYQKLVASLEKDRLNITTISLMERFNITHIYIGSGVSPSDGWKHRWNPRLFLGNPNFILEKNFGNAYLFQFKYTDLNIVFFDDFEHAHWYEYGWQTYYIGYGLGNIMATKGFGYRQKYLKMTAQAVYTISEWKYARFIFREFYVQNSSDVVFSFYLKATEGFHGRDTFAVIVSNIYRNQSMVIATPNGVFEGYAHTITLGGFEGTFAFNLSKLWYEMFNSSLSDIFVLEFVNLDFDGVENIAYIDNVKITSTSSG